MSGQPSGIVRVLVGGETAGTGFLVSDDGLIATCSHVVAGARPGDLSVVFRFGPPGDAAEVQIQHGCTRPADAQDIAFLRLVGPLPSGVMAMTAGSSKAALGATLRTFGFPDSKPIDGMAGEVRVTGTTSDGGFEVLQLRSNEVSRGFSGGPVWDERDTVVGMVMSVTRPDALGRQDEVAFIRPIEQLIEICDELRPALDHPYRGLEVFDEAHASDYFGRANAGEQLVEMLAGHDLVAVVGVSGSGKSSLVRAGLKQSLERFPLPGLAGRARCLVVAGSMPTLDLVLALAALPTVDDAALTRALGLPAGALDERLSASHAAGDGLMGREPQALAGILRGLVPDGLIVVVDQFERLFTEARDEAVRAQCIETLVAVAGAEVKVLITLRADFYAHALSYPALGRLLGDGQITLAPMTDEELIEAIEMPARRRGRSVEAGLARRIVADVEGRSGELPLLEFALAELWTRDADSGVLQIATYEQLGFEGPDGQTHPGVRGAIAKRAEQLWAELDPVERVAARRVFLSVIGATSTGGASSAPDVSSSRRAWLIELGDAERAVAERLVAARLLTTNRDAYSGQATIEVAHEALIRSWPMLEQWSRTFMAFVDWRDRELAEPWQRWVTHDRKPELLLPAGMLGEARRQQERYGDELSPSHVAYIEASVAAVAAQTALREAEHERTKRLNRRLRTLAIGLGAFFALAVVATLLAVHQTGKARTEARVGTSRLLGAQSRDLADVNPSLSMLLGLAAFNSADTPQARDALEDQFIRNRHVKRVLTSRSGPVGAIAYGANGLLAAAGSGAVTVWDRQGQGPPVVVHGPASMVRAVGFDADGRVLAAGGDGGVAVWDMTTPAHPRRVAAWGDAAVTLAVAPDGRRVVFAAAGTTIVVRDVAGGRRTTIDAPELRRIQQVAVTPDGRSVVAVGVGGARMWSLATHALQRRFDFPDPGALAKTPLALSADGRRLAVAHGLALDLWDVASGAKVGTLTDAPESGVLAFRPDGGALATTETEAADPTPISAFAVHANGFARSAQADPLALDSSDYASVLLGRRRSTSSLAYSPDGRTLASGGADSTVTLWDPASPETIRSNAVERIDTVALDAKGATLALGGTIRGAKSGDEVSFVDPRRGREIAGLRCARFATPGPGTASWVISGPTCFNRLEIVNPRRRAAHGLVTQLGTDRRLPQRFLSQGDEVSPRGDLIAEYAAPLRRLGPGRGLLFDKELMLWDPRRPHAQVARVRVARADRFSSVPARERSFAFSPTGRTLAIGRSYDHTTTTVGNDDSVLLWDTRSRRTTATLPTPGTVESVAFDPGGTLLAVGLKDRVMLWRLADRKLVGTVGNVRGAAVQLAFTSDGSRLLVGDYDGVQLWTLTPLAKSGVQLAGDGGIDPGRPSEFALSPDGREILIADGSQAVVRWPLEAGSWRRRLCAILDRDLSAGERNRYLPASQRSARTCPKG